MRSHQSTVMLTQWIKEMSAGPLHPERYFIQGGATVASVYAMAGKLQKAFHDCGADLRQICLCTGDRALAASAVLASLDGRTRLLLPHAPSAKALNALHQHSPYSAAVIDSGLPLPEGVSAIRPPVSVEDEMHPEINIPLDMDWVMLFTGGSTQKPRIWSKSPLNLLGEALLQATLHGIGPTDTILATVSPLHIYGLLFSVLIPLVSGAAVVPGTPVFPAEILDSVEQFSASVLVSIPAHYRALGTGLAFGGSLKTAFSSAGPLAPETGAAFTNRTGVPVVEVYGSTETGGIATRCRSVGESEYIPLSVVDWQVSGSHLSVRSPFLSAGLPTNEDGFYQTDDKAVLGESGGFLLGGRTDSVIKVGGKRVDLETIRESLLRIEAVTNACVLAMPAGGTRGNTITALVETNQDRETLIAKLAMFLEPHEMPKRLYTIGILPLTAAGKVDREAIAQIIFERVGNNENSGQEK